MLRRAKPISIKNWRGLNSFTPETEVSADVWFDSNNVLVNTKGHAEVLRSPKAFGTAIGGSGTVTGLTEYTRNLGHALIADRGTSSYYLTAAGGAPTLLRSGQSGAAWTSLNINDRMYRMDGSEFTQILDDFSSYKVGLDPPAAAPVIAYPTNGSSANVAITVSFQGSYCYRNSKTGHVSTPSPLSNILTPATGHNAISFAVEASQESGVDQIIFFLTEDGGDIPYLVIDCDDGDTTYVANTTGTKYIYLALTDRDTLTPEPIYNYPPPEMDLEFVFIHKDRIFGIVDGQLRFSGYETCYIGQPWESWPVLNQLNVPNKSDRAVGGISTQVGAVVFGKLDSYLLSGTPSDKASSPNNPIALTEHMEPLKWSLGIKYPKTAVDTPFGIIWTDQTGRIQNWTFSGMPTEIGLPLRSEIKAMTGALKACWFQHGKNGGYYILTNGTETLFLMVYKSDETGELQFGFGKSDISLEDIATATFETQRFFFTKTDKVYELLDPDTAGDGWAAGTNIFFELMLGNDGNFSAVHSMQVLGDLDGMTVTLSASDETEEETITLEEDWDTGGAVFGIVDSPARRRHLMAFSFDTNDENARQVQELTLFGQGKRRAI